MLLSIITKIMMIEEKYSFKFTYPYDKHLDVPNLTKQNQLLLQSIKLTDISENTTEVSKPYKSAVP